VLQDTLPSPVVSPVSEHEKAPSRMPVAPLLEALARLGSAARIDVDQSAARRAIEQATLDRTFVGEDAWLEELTRAGEQLGIKVRAAKLSAAALVREPRALPLVSLSSKQGEAIAILEQRRERVLALRLSGRERARWMRAAELAHLMGAPDASSDLMWASSEPLAPMAAMANGADGGGASPLRRLLSLLRLERDDIAVAVIYAIGVGVVSLAAPIGVQALVNTVAFGGLLQPIIILTLLVLAALAFAGALRALQAWVVERIQQRVFARVAIDLGYRLPRVRVAAFDNAHGPELINRFFDVLTVQKGAASLLVDGTSIALSVLVGTLLLAFYHPILLVFDLTLIVVVFALMTGLGRGAVKTSIKESKAKYAVAAWLEEMARHPGSFKSAGGSAFAEARAEDLLCEYLAARRKHFKVIFRQIVAALSVQALATAALLGVGGYLVMSGKITLGQLVAAELIVTAVVVGISKLGKYLESFYDLCAAVDKLGQLVDLPLEPPRGSPLPRAAGGARVRLKGVSFTYEGRAPVLDGASIEIAPGARVAVIGPNGSGKSTLSNLIYGLRAPADGRVEIDGRDLRDLDLGSVREQIALVRGVEIFEGTIEENLRMGRSELCADDVRAALETVGLWDELNAFPDGLQTKLTSGGPSLSAGQARRLVLARALAGKPRLLILDESLDDLDPPARKALSRALLGRAAPWSALVTTHDREALRDCDEVYVLSAGKLRPLRAEDLPAS